jgi:cytochrome P450
MNPGLPAEAPTDEWCADHFDYASPILGTHIHDALRRLRAQCPVTRTDQYGGHWVVTGYEDVLGVAQDWKTFSSAKGVGLTQIEVVVPPIPEWSDPPIHREYKRLINAYFTPVVVSRYEEPIRDLVSGLIDAFIENGRCEFMSEFARPFPGLAFFDQVLHAPPDQLAEINQMSMAASVPNHPKGREAWEGMFRWMTEFVKERRSQAPQGDVVDAILAAEIEGRPITDTEVYGLIQLLILGGLDTTAGALGQFMIRFARQPEVPALLRDRPDLIPEGIEELLRLDGPFVFIARTATEDCEVRGRTIKEGERVLISWASANRDESEFPEPDRFDPFRKSIRHLAFGAGPHRCAGSNFARMNLRIALEELLRRIGNVELQEPEGAISFHSAFNRAPIEVPITFTPGPRRDR